LEQILKEAVVAYFTILSGKLYGVIEEGHKRRIMIYKAKSRSQPGIIYKEVGSLNLETLCSNTSFA
jgi:hypothetical protein